MALAISRYQFRGNGLVNIILVLPLTTPEIVMGSSLFIPIFLVSVGVLLEPRVMIDPKTLLVAGVFTLAVLGGKTLAAVIAGRIFRFAWPEIGVMAGLSGSQAAATLASHLDAGRAAQRSFCRGRRRPLRPSRWCCLWLP